ncbi:hypothetical protein IQ272_12005, partial [Chroococcidiopsidales cyanobacterium LEGE 13417]|nr:hypothetical protein [Chroococcidiopsidales cyanobacterium LEGE 13417]
VDYYRQQIDLVTVNGDRMLSGDRLEDTSPLDNDLSDDSDTYFDDEE